MWLAHLIYYMDRRRTYPWSRHGCLIRRSAAATIKPIRGKTLMVLTEAGMRSSRPLHRKHQCLLPLAGVSAVRAQRLFAIERYIALDVFERFDLDVGKHLRENAPALRPSYPASARSRPISGKRSPPHSARRARPLRPSIHAASAASSGQHCRRPSRFSRGTFHEAVLRST